MVIVHGGQVVLWPGGCANRRAAGPPRHSASEKALPSRSWGCVTPAAGPGSSRSPVPCAFQVAGSLSEVHGLPGARYIVCSLLSTVNDYSRPEGRNDVPL